MRLAHFISAFLQSVSSNEMYGNFIGDGKLNEEQLFGEVTYDQILRSSFPEFFWFIS